MKTFHRKLHAPTEGFTLIETLIVMVVLGIAAVVIANLSGNLFLGQTANRGLVVGAQLMQQCAERLLARGRVSYTDACLADSTSATSCCAVTGSSVTLTAGKSTDTGFSACPYTTGTDCKLISVRQSGMTPVVLMLVKH